MKSAANAENIRTKGHKNISASRHTGMDLRPYVLRVSGSLRRQPLCFFGYADVSPWPAAQRPFVYLMKTYVAYVFRAKRLTQALYLLFFCPFVLMFSALAARYGVSPYVFWATWTSVRGQPRSGLLCILCKPMLLMSSALSG